MMLYSITSHTVLQNYYLFLYRLFFLEDTFSESVEYPENVGSDLKKLSSRIFDVTFCPDIRYPVSGNLLIINVIVNVIY